MVLGASGCLAGAGTGSAAVVCTGGLALVLLRGTMLLKGQTPLQSSAAGSGVLRHLPEIEQVGHTSSRIDREVRLPSHCRAAVAGASGLLDVSTALAPGAKSSVGSGLWRIACCWQSASSSSVDFAGFSSSAVQQTGG
jgi:hypothetical protein